MTTEDVNLVITEIEKCFQEMEAEGRWRKTQNRKKYSPDPKGFLLGKCPRPGRTILSPCHHNKVFPKLHFYLHKLAVLHSIKYVTIQVNRTSERSELEKLHTDGNNGEVDQPDDPGVLTNIIGFGTYGGDGGELEAHYNDEEGGIQKVNIFHRFYQFRACKIPHRPCPYPSGTRYSAVFFKSRPSKNGCSCKTLRCMNPECNGQKKQFLGLVDIENTC